MKILYVTTVSGTINAFLIPHIKMLIDLGHTVDIACSITSPIDKKIYEYGCNVHEIGFSRSPLSKKNVYAFRKLRDTIIAEEYDIVHTHTPVASTIARLACRNLRKIRVIYTAHGFHFFKGAPIKNWLFYYPVEKWLSKYTDTLITINNEDYERAKTFLKAKKVEYIPGVGLDIDKFRNVVVDKAAKRQEIGAPQDSFVVLSVGELNKNKNHEVVIRAIAKLNNPKIHYVICGRGPLEKHLNKLAKELGIGKNVHLLGFRSDIAEICKSSDVFAFPSLREGLGMAALEAMACGLPIITSNVHGIVDYSIDGETGYNCSPESINCFSNRIEKIFQNDELRYNFSEKSTEIVHAFILDKSLTSISRIYNID